MSWQSFKTNVKVVMDNPQSIQGIEGFAKTLTNEYDSAIKQGGDLIHKVPLKFGNKELMETYIILALYKGVVSPSEDFNLINEIGKAVQMYWNGATLYETPIPLLPSPGSTTNLSVTSNIVTYGGKWPTLPISIPVKRTEIWLNLFILAATLHLLTVQGVIQTISLYPPLGNPAPGVISWGIYLLKPPTFVKLPEFESKFKISQLNEVDVCTTDTEIEVLSYPPFSSLGNMKGVDVSDAENLNENNFWLSDSKGYREFKWVSYPRIAVPISTEVGSCSVS
jgi:hypothetical protein